MRGIALSRDADRTKLCATKERAAPIALTMDAATDRLSGENHADLELRVDTGCFVVGLVFER